MALGEEDLFSCVAMVVDGAPVWIIVPKSSPITSVAGLKGNIAAGVGTIFESLMTPALDEVASEYGLIAETVNYPEDFSWAIYRLRPQAQPSRRGSPTPAGIS